MIQFNCPRCRGALSVADDNAGRHTWCRSCQRVVMVPAALAEAPVSVAIRPTPATPMEPPKLVGTQQPEIDSLRESLEETRADNARKAQAKTQQLDNLQRNLEHVQAERDDLANDLNDQQSRVAKLEQDLVKSEQDLSESKAEIEHLETKLESSAHANAATPPQDHTSEWEREKAALDAELTEIRSTLAQRDRDLNELRRTAEDVDALREKIASLEGAVHERDSLRSQLHANNETAENEAAALAALQERLRDSEANNATLTQQIQEASAFAKNAPSEQQTEELHALQSQLDAARSATAAEQSALSDLQEKLWNAELNAASLNDRIVELESQVDGIDALKEKSAAHEALQHEAASLREQLAATTQADADGRAATTAAQEKLQNAESHIADQSSKLEEALRDAEDMRDRLAAATQAGTDDQSAMAGLQAKLRDAESNAAELNARIAELTSQTRELDALRQKTATLDEVQRDAANLREQLQFANEAGVNDRNALTGLQEKLQHAESQVTELTNRASQSTDQAGQIETLRQQLIDAAETLSAAEARAAEFEPRIQSLDAERANLVDSLETTVKRADLAETRAQQTETDLEARTAELARESDLLAETQRDVETAKTEADSLRASIAEQAATASNTADTTSLESELQDVRADLERKSDEINSLSAEVESERARANAAEARAAMPDDALPEADESLVSEPIKSESNVDTDEQSAEDEEPPSEEDEMVDALMRFLDRQ